MSLLAIFTAAVAFWGQGNLPTCGQPQLQVRQLGENAGMAYQRVCIAAIDEKYADLYNGVPNRYRCAIIFHEVGHLYGMQHSERGVMAETVTYIPPVCKRVVPLSRSEKLLNKIVAHTAREQK